MRHPRQTRAELAAATGISKPTVGESVRRLVALGLVADTGDRTPGGRGRGRVGTYYALAPGVGVALAISIAPEGVTAECVSAYGEVVSRAEEPIGRPARPERVAAALRAVVTRTLALSSIPPTNHNSTTDHTGPAGVVGRPPVRLAMVSAADPVDRATGRMVHLPDSPFLLGDLDPVAILAPLGARPAHGRHRGKRGPPRRTRRHPRAQPGRLRLPLPGRGPGLRRGRRRRGPPRPRGPGRRDRPPVHRRPGRSGGHPDQRLRPARPAPARRHRHRPGPPARRHPWPRASRPGHPPNRRPSG